MISTIRLNFYLLAAAVIEKHAVKQSPSRIEDLVKIFIQATKASSPEHVICGN